MMVLECLINRAPSAGMGLRIMRHRARMLGGQLDIHEEAAQGCHNQLLFSHKWETSSCSG